jgi:adenylate cyclase
MNRKLACILIVLAVSLLTAIGIITQSLATVENRTWDWRARFISHQHSADPKIKLIVVDQASLDYYAKEESITWPWPRALYVPVIKFLEKAGARGLAFDLLLTESSASGVEDDKELAASFSSKLPIVSAVALSQNGQDVGQKNRLLKPFANSPSVPANWSEFYVSSPNIAKFSSPTVPVPEILSASAALGVVNASNDLDGIFRHYQPGALLLGNPLPSLPLALFLATNAGPINSINNFLNDRSQLTIRFRGQGDTYSAQSIANIIASYVNLSEGKTPKIDPADYKDALVFLGVWAPGLYDLRPTPLDPNFPGVEFNATVLDNLIHQDFIHEASATSNILFAVIFIFAISVATLFVKRTLTQILAGICILVLFVAAGVLAASNGIWIAMAIPGLGTILAMLLSILYQYQHEGRQHRFIKRAFSHYVSPDVIDQIIRDPSNLSLGGERRELTIFFSDLAGFTTLSEKLDPAVLVRLLNAYLSAMTDIILGSGGTLDKYEGDAIIAFWNAPLALSDYSDRAVKSAILCQRKLAEMNPDFKREFGVELSMRIGLNSGSVSVGNFGSRDRFNYTIIGDAANLASRLEGTNKVFGTKMLISEGTINLLQSSIAMRKIGAVRVVGRAQPVTVFEPRAINDLVESDYHNFEQGIAQFEAGNLAQAQTYFSKVTNDLAAKSYLRRIQIEISNPVENWSPVWELSEK